MVCYCNYSEKGKRDKVKKKKCGPFPDLGNIGLCTCSKGSYTCIIVCLILSKSAAQKIFKPLFNFIMSIQGKLTRMLVFIEKKNISLFFKMYLVYRYLLKSIHIC